MAGGEVVPNSARDSTRSNIGMASTTHFFTVLSSPYEPFIRHHIDVFRQVASPWHWHILVPNEEATKDSYLKSLKEKFPQNFSLFPLGTSQPVEALNAILSNAEKPCLAWRIDVHELWLVEQLVVLQQLFREHPSKHFAEVESVCFLGFERVVNESVNLGVRVCRIDSGDNFESYDPFSLTRQFAQPQGFSGEECSSYGLMIQDFRLATSEQVLNFEASAKISGLFERWRALQRARTFPISVETYVPGLGLSGLIALPEQEKISPIARRNVRDEWRFRSNMLPARSPQQVLIVRNDAIGDAVLAAGILEQLHKKYPGAGFSLICQDSVREFYEACPFIDDLLSYDETLAILDKAYRDELVAKIESVHADVVINSVYSARPFTHFLALHANAESRISVHGDLSNISEEERSKFESLYTEIIQVPVVGLEVRRHQEFVRGLGIDDVQVCPQFWTLPEDESRAEELLKELNLDGSRAIAVYAGAREPARCVRIIGSALKSWRNDFAVIALGSAQDWAINEEVGAAFAGRFVNLCGRTNLRQTAALLRRMRLAVGADTSLGHIAAAVGTRHVTILGGGHFGRFVPWSALTSVVCLPLECYGCNWRCRFSRAHCVQDVKAEVVSEAVAQTLSASAPKPRVFIQTVKMDPQTPPYVEPQMASRALADVTVIPLY